MITKQTIARLVSEDPQPFAGVRPAYLGDAPSRPASVLMLFADGPQGLEVLLTKRARHLRIHAGQVSFPGGKPEAMMIARQVPPCAKPKKKQVCLPIL